MLQCLPTQLVCPPGYTDVAPHFSEHVAIEHVAIEHDSLQCAPQSLFTADAAAYAQVAGIK